MTLGNTSLTRGLQELLTKNEAWVARIDQEDPEFFQRLARQHAPQLLWIGCSDARVPANQIVDLMPGEIFVHRNVANLVVHTDFNCLSVVQFAVEVLKVKHIVVCGHYGCGGVQAALEEQGHGIIDNWLRHVIDVKEKHLDELQQCKDFTEKHRLLCELNVKQQVRNLCRTSILRDAWSSGLDLTVYGWIYSLEDGLLKDLGITENACNA